ncbi:MAG: tripartite tricarboxylate transporter substrate binding protein [Burkholderiales bacterium]|nr:tripartite tricarboxylate transporter substrate binding protein [Burkholderiales bacterium]
MTSQRLFAGVLLGLALFAAAAAHAQRSYPQRPIRLVVPFAPGGGTDISGRTIAAKLSGRLNQHVIVDNRPGAGGNIGIELVAKAVPDGYTLLIVSSGYGANPSLYKLSYDPVTGFEPITQISQQPFLVVTNSTVPFRSAKEMIAYAKTNPGKLNYSSAGIGGSQHLAVELFKARAGVDLVHVPYRGGASNLADLVSNQVQLDFGTIISTLPLARSGQLRALAVTTSVRSPAVPDVPTLAESGVPGYSVSGWNAILAPAGTPREVVEVLNREIVALLQLPDVKERYATDGSMVVAGTPQQLAQHIRQEVAKWAKLIKERNIRLESSAR